MPPYSEIDPKTLTALQNAIADVLREFIRVCDALGIPYVVYGGTAIGAVRHEGFIPWDDDADVCLLRGDYERFLLEAPSILKPEFFIENSRTHEDFPGMFSFLGIRDTVFVSRFIEKSPYTTPVKLDIFPLDEVAPTSSRYKRQILAAWFWGRMLYVQGTPTPYLAFGGLKKSLVYAATGVGYWTMRLLRVKPRHLQKCWEKAARKYEGLGTKQYTDFTDLNPRAWEVSLNELYPARDAKFGPLTVKVPREYDNVLRRGYGDYMQMPPVDRRKTDEPARIELGMYGPRG